VGVVAGEDDPERLERLLTRLVAEVRRRRRVLDEAGAADLDELRTAHPDRAVPHVVLLVDSWAGISEGDGPAEQAGQELLGEGASAAGVTLCVAGDERLLRYRILNRLDHRLCLRLNNPSDATVLGIGGRTVDGLPAGRGVWADDGSTVQVPLLVDDPAGTAQSAALAALGRELRERYGTPEGPDAPMRLDPLPAVASQAWAERLGPPRPEGCAALVGVSGDHLRAVWARFDAGTGPLIIAGPARSGRSTAAAGVAVSTAAGGARVLLVAPRPGPAHGAAQAAGVQLLAPLDLAGALDAGAPDVVVIDDADTAGLDDALVARLTGPRAPALAVAGLLDSFGIGVRGLLQAARNRPGPVVLLSPPNHLAAANVNVRLDRTGAFSGPPGRAWLMVDGELLLGQVPDPTVA
jgi:S-DNA-T family DNA segregation ATPase FtsK/SpoIIIE